MTNEALHPHAVGAEPLVVAADVRKRFGSVEVLKGISLQVA